MGTATSFLKKAHGLRVFGLILVVVIAFSGSPALVQRASADGELGVSIREVEVDRSALVRFLAKVVDESGRPQRLSEGSFSVRVGEQQVPITGVVTVTDAAVGVSALLLIDTSGSMVGTPLADARNAAAQYVQSLLPNDEVGVLSFSNTTNVISDFSADFAGVDALLPNLVAFGDTALYDAVGDAAQRMADRPAARRVVIMLSDGADFGISTVSRDNAVAAAASSGAPFYVIGLGPTIDTAFLQDVANASGGAYFAAPSSDQLASVFTEIAELLRSEYVVTVDFAGTGLGGDTTAIVRAESGGLNGEVSITLGLPAIPVAPQPRPTEVTSIPQPVQVPSAEPEEGGGSSVGLILALLVLVGAVVAWLFWRRHKRRRKDDGYVFGSTPIFSPRDAAIEPVIRNAPPAVLRLESGDEFRFEGVATLGVSPENTFQIPLSRSDFGNAELRVWFANDRYVIRDGAPRTRMRVNGRPSAWSFLSDGDEIEIKGLKLRFSMTADVVVPSEG